MKTTPPCRNAPKRRAASRGFSLIEVMVSGTLLLLGLAGAVVSTSTYTRMANSQRHLTQGIHLAEGLMEEVLLQYPSDPDLDSGTHGPVYFDEAGHESATVNTYAGYWTVVASDPIAGIRKLTVRIEWKEGDNDKNIEFFTYRR